MKSPGGNETSRGEKLGQMLIAPNLSARFGDPALDQVAGAAMAAIGQEDAANHQPEIHSPSLRMSRYLDRTDGRSGSGSGASFTRSLRKAWSVGLAQRTPTNFPFAFGTAIPPRATRPQPSQRKPGSSLTRDAPAPAPSSARCTPQPRRARSSPATDTRPAARARPRTADARAPGTWGCDGSDRSMHRTS